PSAPGRSRGRGTRAFAGALRRVSDRSRRRDRSDDRYPRVGGLSASPGARVGQGGVGQGRRARVPETLKPSGLQRMSFDKYSVAFTVNGHDITLDVSARTSLAEALRNELGLTGTHIGCEHG